MKSGPGEIEPKRVLLVDDRLWTLDTIVREFTSVGWQMTTASSLVDGVAALREARFTAAVFDLHFPRPQPEERLRLEQMGMPIAWVDATDDYLVGTVLGRFVRERLHDQMPFLYISALPSTSEREADAVALLRRIRVDKYNASRKVTLGQEVFARLAEIAPERSSHGRAD